MDDLDIDRESRKLAAIGNILVWKFEKCLVEVKCRLFRTNCYQLYGCSLWSRFRRSTLSSSWAWFNNILRKRVDIAQWFSASGMFANLRVLSLQEVLRNVSHSFMLRTSSSENSLLCTIRNSEVVFIYSVTKHRMT